MTSTEGRLTIEGRETWYRVTGDLSTGVPLVLLHGGPGAAHDYLDSLTRLASEDRAVIHYDQVGCGLSTHLPEAPKEFWTVQLFLDELSALLAHLGIADNYDVLGQSWGGMLGAEHAITRPKGLRKLILSNSPASIALWVSEANRLRADLDPATQERLTRYEALAEYDNPEYLEAVQVFYDRHVCRVIPNPEEVQRSFRQMGEDPTVYMTMNGPTEFHCIGSLVDWSVVDRVHQIEVPTLLLSGHYDEATPATVQPFADAIPDVRWHIFENSSHMPFVEEPEAFDEVVLNFLQ
ncbi:MAG: proline iminopeptidase-family hydrolase [Acidobacteria bacterium]|nr:proline iminopeptidase-family hydrolase [Acidobacteriota bacterium]